MRISDAIAPARPLAVPFEGDTLNITYRMASTSAAELDAQLAAARAVEEENKKAGRPANAPNSDTLRKYMISMAGDGDEEGLILTWDLTEDDGKTPIEISVDRFMTLPLRIFGEIMKAVNKDQQVGEADAPSAAG